MGYSRGELTLVPTETPDGRFKLTGYDWVVIATGEIVASARGFTSAPYRGRCAADDFKRITGSDL